MSRYHKQYRRSDRRILFLAKRRDNYQCQICGSPYKVQSHHIVPLSQGGKTELSNLETLCLDCHNRTHRRGPVSDWLKLVWARQYGE